MSHEFHLPADVGEDVILQCDSCGHGSNIELIAEADSDKPIMCEKCQSPMRKQNGIEVGHAFLLGTKYSKVLQANYYSEDNRKGTIAAEMGCYGLGVSRILQASVETLHENKIRWPSLIAPYQICIIPQMKGYGSEAFNAVADSLSDALCSKHNLRHEVFIDDRTDMTVGKRLKEADSQGFPYAIVIGKKCLEEPKQYEVMHLTSGTNEFLSLEQVTDKFSTLQTL